jgi:broad specificity phosphatase PhoE
MLFQTLSLSRRSMTVYYITHPQIRIDPAVPIPDWGLSDHGRLRAEAMLRQNWIPTIARVVASAERKAIETADILVAHLGVELDVRPGMHENDRRATGFLPPAEFEQVADLFFANPSRSVRGWERALDAQERIMGEVDDILADQTADNIAIIGHGGVGTLLMLALAGEEISRKSDQPAGGGNYFAFDTGTRRLLHRWKPIDVLE